MREYHIEITFIIFSCIVAFGILINTLDNYIKSKYHAEATQCDDENYRRYSSMLSQRNELMDRLEKIQTSRGLFRGRDLYVNMLITRIDILNESIESFYA